LAKYKRKAFIRAKAIDVGLAAYRKGGKLKYQLRISNLSEKDITEVDYNKHNWITVFDGDILRIRIKKDYSQGLVIFKHNGAVVALPDERVIRRLHADIKKVLYKWHISDMNKWLKIFKAELSKGMPEKGGDN
jgi:hypothetical protein